MDFRYRPAEAAHCLGIVSASALVTVHAHWSALHVAFPALEVRDLLLVDEGRANRPDPPDLPDLPDQEDRLSTVFFTSGTTSRPKGVTHTSRRTFSRIEKFIEEAALSADTVSLVPISLMRPLSFQLLAMAVFRAGGTVVTMAEFSAEKFWTAYLGEPSPTLLALSPNLLGAVLANPLATTAPARSRAVWLIGGDRTPASLHARFREVMGYEIVELCGMTETGPYAMNPIFGEKRVGSAGVPPIGVALRLLDAEDNDVPPGEVGQVVVRTPDTMVGYWNDTLASFEVLRDGWMRTGDLARADEQGYLWHQGRLKDMIVRDGSNIAPAELEAVSLTDTGVAAAVAIGVPDPPRGEAVHLFVVARSRDDAALGARLEKTLSDKLRPLAVPSRIHVVEAFPLTQAGKVDKARLRATVSL